MRGVTAAVSGLLLLGPLVSTGHASAAITTRMTIAPAHALPVGSVVGTPLTASKLTVRVDLAPRDPAALQSFADAVSTPGNPLYQQYLGKGQFSGRFGATSATIAAVRTWLGAQGIGTTTSPDGLYLSATGTASAMDTAFSTTVSSVSASGAHFYANTRSISAPVGVASDIVSVTGLSNVKAAVAQYVGSHPAVRMSGATPGAARSNAMSSSPVSPCADAQSYHNPVQGPFTTTDLANAYHRSLTGTSGLGETIALYELSTGSQSDMQGYDACFGVNPTITTVPVDSGTTDNSGNIEVLLDTEIAASAAPGAAIDLYTGPNTDAGYLDTFSAIARDDAAQVVSVSWGACESQNAPGTLTAENTVFQEMAAQGQSVFVASGDSGSSGCYRTDGDTSTQPTDPGAQPYVTSVGGTTIINATCIGTSPTCEVVWNEAYGSGGSGGHSAKWKAPGYQSSLKAKWREFPDISALASMYGGYLVYDATDSSTDSPWFVIGGTSGASPLEAAFTADSLHSARRGLLNPLLYRLGEPVFNDVTVGSNNVVSTFYNTYVAALGYDMASGLGSPNWSLLAPHVRTGK